MPNEPKNYTVSITAFATVLVIAAESREQALEIATQEISMGSLQLDEARVVMEIPEGPALETARRHADYIAEE